MDITIEKILILVMFFIPGFVYLKTFRLFIASDKVDFSKDWYEAIGISIINFIVLAYPIYLLNSSNLLELNPFLYFLFTGLIVLIAPILWAWLFHKFFESKWYSKFLITPTKSAWDSFFSNRESYYVLITLKSGRKIGGKYGTKSFSSVYPHQNEIYLEEVWKLNENDGFDQIEEQTKGILITQEEISTIEFYI